MIRKARIDDVPTIHRVVNEYAQQGRLLPRSLSELYTHIRDMHVYEDGQSAKLLGWSALHISWEDLAEVRSLVVLKEHRRRGIGRRLVEACLDESRRLGIPRVFVLTYETQFFTRLGFKTVDKHIFPQKIWTDCLHCTKFPDCDETAMLLEMDPYSINSRH